MLYVQMQSSAGYDSLKSLPSEDSSSSSSSSSVLSFLPSSLSSISTAILSFLFTLPLPISSTLSPTHPLFVAFWQFFTFCFLPQSISNDRGRQRTYRQSDSAFEQLTLRSAEIQPCDLLLVKTPNTLYKCGRQLGNSEYDHLGIMMNNGMFLHVGAPAIRLLPIEILAEPDRQLLVLRPQLAQEEKTVLLDRLSNLVGQRYDYSRAISLLTKLILRRFTDKINPLSELRSYHTENPTATNSTNPNSNPEPESTQYAPEEPLGVSSARAAHICTDAILESLNGVSPSFLHASNTTPNLDRPVLNSWSINDVLTLAKHSPELLRPVNIPPPSTPLKGREQRAQKFKFKDDDWRRLLELFLALILLQSRVRNLASFFCWLNAKRKQRKSNVKLPYISKL